MKLNSKPTQIWNKKKIKMITKKRKGKKEEEEEAKHYRLLL
jgi:hypothetical protein